MQCIEVAAAIDPTIVDPTIVSMVSRDADRENRPTHAPREPVASL
jgi:hypothetical protein